MQNGIKYMLISSSKHLLYEEERVLLGGEEIKMNKLTPECPQCAKERKTPSD